MLRFLACVYTFAVVLQAQLPTNLDCKCTATGDGEYLCKCVPSKGSSETLSKSMVAPNGTSTAYVMPEPPMTTAGTKPALSTTTKANETPTGTTTAKGQEIYTGPRGGQYHYSSSGKKVYTRKK